MKISKKILAIVLTVVMLISVMPFAVFAEDAVTTTAAFEAAVAAFNAGEDDATITLGADIALAETATIDTANGKTLTITGKYTITGPATGSAFYVKHGSLYLTGKVTVTGAASNYKLIYLTGTTNPEDANYSNVTVKDATVNCSNGYAIMISANNGCAYGANITVTGQTSNVYGFYGALYVNGSIKGNVGDNLPSISVLNYEGNKILSDPAEGTAVYGAGYAKYNFKRGTFEAATALYIKAGIVTISGGVYNGLGAQKAYNAMTDGYDPTGDAVVLEANTGYAPVTSVAISGGTFNSTNAAPVSAYSNSASVEAPSKFISGGIFKTNGVPADVSEFYTDALAAEFAEGTKVINQAGNIVAASSIQAKIGNVNYSTLSGALSAAVAGDKVVIQKDLSMTAGTFGTSKWTVANGITVDLNGKTLTENTKDDTAISLQGGSVELINGTIVGDIALFNASHVTLGNKLVLNGKQYALSANHNESVGASATIKSGATVTTSSETLPAIYWPQAGALTIQGGTITGPTAIYIRTGSLTISGGTFNGTGAAADASLVANGADATGDALAIQAYSSAYGAAPVVSITGGTFKSTNKNAVATYEASSGDTAPTNFITGGTFKKGTDKSDVSAYYDTAVYTQDDNGKVIVKANIAAEVTDAKTGKVTYVTSTTGQLQIQAQTVKLLKDFNATNFITHIFAGQDAVLDLNGHTFTSTATNRSGFVVRPNTKLVIKNSAENEAYINIPVDADVQGELVLEDGVTLNGNIAYFGSATLTIDGTVIGSDDTYAISSNNTQASGTTLNITENAVITSADGIAIYHPEAGTVNISGGTITGKTALYAKRGDINISGGTFNGTGAAAAYAASGNGANATGDAVVFDNMKGYAGTLSATITGGDFNSANAKAVASYATGLDPVTGFLGMTGDATFSSDVTELCATGYKADLEGTKYIVVEIDVAGATNGAELEVEGDIEINTYFDADVYVQEFNLNPATAELRVTYNAKSDIDRNPEYVTDVYNLATEAEQVDESEVSDAAFAQTYKNSNIIAPAQITEEVVVGLYASSEATIPVKEVHYSVYKMMRNIIENAASYSPELVAYAQATIDYGKAAQNYFAYRAADLASIEYSEAAIAAPSVAALDSTFGRPAANLPYDLQATGVSLTIKSQVEVNVTTAANFVIGEVSNGAAADFAEVNGKRCLVITDITAANTLKSINVGVNGDYLIISALNICRSIIGGNNSANYKSLAMALAFYGQAAEAYYATQA